MTVEFRCAVPDVNLEPLGDGVTFLRRGELREVAPFADDLIDELVALASAASGLPLERVDEEAWMHVVPGPAAGIDWHDEGFTPDDLSLVAALNTVTGGDLLVGEERYPHVRGRCVLFPSSTLHKVEPVDSSETRVSLAMLLRKVGP